jgi:predicted DCC family thiol-disulfide oxidoreductase YuxK
MEGRHWLLWDGECGMCAEVARWVRRKDTRKQFIICQYQNCPTPPMNPALFERCKFEMAVVTEDGRELGGARGVLFILSKIGWGWFARLLAAPPFIWPIMLGYLLVARNRGFFSKLLFRNRACGLENRYPDIDTLK